MEATISRREIETQLIEKCWKDPLFREQVTRDPKGMFEKFLGQKLPEQLKIVIHSEDPTTLHLSIPPAPANINELSDEELERVAGGTDIIGTVIALTSALGGLAVSGGVIASAVNTVKSGW